MLVIWAVIPWSLVPLWAAIVGMPDEWMRERPPFWAIQDLSYWQQRAAMWAFILWFVGPGPLAVASTPWVLWYSQRVRWFGLAAVVGFLGYAVIVLMWWFDAGAMREALDS